ncbi:MAG: hypothetical protein AAF402_00605 [Pseudomonadota bacterium]
MSKSKRTLLKSASIMGAGGLVASWQTPVVQSVVLPAHAQTTDPTATTTPALPAAPLAFSQQGAICTSLCAIGVDDAQYNTPVLENQSAESITVTGIQLSNPDHYVETMLPLMISSADNVICGFSILVKDSGNLCGDAISGGTMTLQLEGYQDFSFNIPA